MTRARSLIGLFCLVSVISGCRRRGDAASGEERTVVLYTSVDEPYAKPLIQQFERDTGIAVTLVTDAEASKSVGLAEKLRAERDHPNADVWWSNECFLTINLADDGVLAPYASPSAADIPAPYKDGPHRWAASVLRVRMLVWSATDSTIHTPPSRVQDLLRPDFKDRIALARPTAGTTGGHVAALCVLWGKAREEDFFRRLHDNGVTLVGGNSVVAESVARGELRIGLCDNDDAADAAANIGKLGSALPDQQPGGDGTLAIPCATGLVAHAEHPQAARRLIDFLLSRDTARVLVDARFAWCSTRGVPPNAKFMPVDYHEVARTMPAAIRSATALMEGR